MFLGSHLIIGVITFMAVGLAVTYTLSVALGHTHPLWCYISYTGNYGIEGCIFSFVFTLCSALYVFITLLRYVQVLDMIDKTNFSEKKKKRMKVTNAISLVFGIGGSFGLSLAGCFQQRIFHLLHIIGVLFCTYFTLVYVIFQTYFSFALPTLAKSPMPIMVLRATIAAFTSLIIACGSIFTFYFCSLERRDFDLLASSTAPEEDSGFKIGVGLEWFLFVLNQMFICSFYPDFKKIALKKDKIVFL